MRSSRIVAPKPNTIANAERSDSRTWAVRAPSAIGSYDTDVASNETGPSPIDPSPVDADAADARDAAPSIDFDPRSAIPIGIAVALLAIAVWFVRSIPRTLSS